MSKMFRKSKKRTTPEGFVNPNVAAAQAGIANPMMTGAGAPLPGNGAGYQHAAPLPGGGAGYQDAAPLHGGGGAGYQDAAPFHGGGGAGYQEAAPLPQGVPMFNVKTYDVPTIMNPGAEAKGGYMAVDPQWLEEQNQLMARKPWFRKTFTRKDSLRYLNNEAPGAFVVRISSQPGHYAISCQMGYKVENMLILPSWDPTETSRGATLYRLGSGSKAKFASVPALIYYYAQNAFYTDRMGGRHYFTVSPQELTAVKAHVDRGGNVAGDGYMEVSGLNDDQDFGESDDFSALAAAAVEPTFSTNVYDNNGYANELPSGDGVQFETNVYDNSASMGAAADPGPRVEFSSNVYDNSPGLAAAAPAADRLQGAGGLVVLGSEVKTYTDLYNAADPTNEGQLGPQEAVAFFRKSGLDDMTLGNIWALADSNQAGFLDKSQVLLALKLCSLAQNGHALELSNVNVDCGPPNFVL